MGRMLKFEGVFGVEAQGSSGGLALLWKNKDDGRVLGYSNSHIDFLVESSEKGAWKLTGFYGEPERNNRHRSWTLLRTLATDSTLPWCVIGDLNNIVRHEDKRGGRPYPQRLIDGFQQALNDCNLIDMELVGHPFTWEKGRGSRNWIEVRLDRALINDAWSQIFQGASLLNLEISSSDHCPLFLEPEINHCFPTNRKFKFENAWLKEPMCFEIVRDCWESEGDDNLPNKLARCADKLSIWGKEVTGNFKARITRCKNEIKRLANKRDTASIQRHKEVKEELFHVLDQRESFWKQRSKQLWLKEGDHNSSYFHKAATTRKRHNKIVSLKNDNGVRVGWENGLDQVMKDYFSTLFQASNSTCQEVVDSVHCSVPNSIHENLHTAISEEEVKKAIFQMHPDKSPGPDGMTPAFYQKCWSIVGRDVVRAVQKFFVTGEFDQSCSKANIVLIPKKKNPEDMTQLRPIALCNVVYKTITKVMVNRMKPYMDTIVADTQSAFIPGRLISDNILISFEVLHYLKRKRKGKEGFMALKLDMSKAYDRIEWPFLEAMLRKLGFDQWWISLLMKCVTTAEYMVVHENKEIGPIIPSRGIRQGDPLSPYLFILCAEGLSALLNKYERAGLIHGCKVANGAPRISHMLFADDSYLYCKATILEANRIKDILQKFEAASGQKVNFAKSSIFYSTNTTQSVRDRISNTLHMSMADENSLYLGLPSTLSRNKSAVLGYLKERVRKRIEGWEMKFLSRAGKEVLIKTVAQSLPSYAMSVFLLPLDITRDMEKAMNKFWWQGANKAKSGIHWFSWDRLCSHKSKGGMGFRHLRDFNVAMLAKQGWRLLSRPNSLVAKVFKARYYPNGSFFTAQLGPNPSYVWRSVLEAQDLVRKGTRWCVFDGEEINVLKEPWLPSEDDPYVHSNHPSLGEAKVRNLMVMEGGSWDVDILNDLFIERDKKLILDIPLNISHGSDKLTWSYESSGIYSVKSGYNLLQKIHGRWDGNEDDLTKFWTKFWKQKIPPKVKNLVWRAARECLPTLQQLKIKRVDVQTSCPVCHSEDESVIHALINCTKVKQVWDRVGIGTTTAAAEPENFLDWFVAAFTAAEAEKKLLLPVLCWAIWSARNDVVWQKKSVTAASIVVLATGYLEQWKNAQNSRIETSWSGLKADDGAEHWTVPSINHIKVNVDATLFDSGNKYGCGLVARDHHGMLIEGKMKLFTGSVSPEVAESIGIREALSWIKRHNWQHVTLETDCLTVVQAIRSEVKMISMFGQIIQECKNLLLELKTISMLFVKRSATMVAHNCARASIFFPGCIFDMESVPFDLLPSLVADFNG
ncbi:hypothetical protein CsatB_011604 [Cannabis sativa]